MHVAVVGGGYWGSKHVRIMSDLKEVDELSVVDPSVERCEALTRTFPKLRSFSHLDAALDEVDALVIATPAGTHARLALQALRAGRHVLVEKPLATSSADARRLVEEAEASGTTLMVGHTFEYNPAVWALRESIESKELGDVYYIDTARLNLGLYQSDINVAWDLAPHDVSIINYLLQSRPSTVRAWGSSHAHAYLEDVAYLRLEYTEPDITAQVHVSWLDPCKVRRVTVVGSKKMAVYNDLATEERLRIYDKGVAAHAGGDGLYASVETRVDLTDAVVSADATLDESLHNFPMSYRYGGIVSPFIAFQEPLAIEDEHFVQCARDGVAPKTDGRNGLAVVEVLEAAGTSMREGRPVHIDKELADSF